MVDLTFSLSPRCYDMVHVLIHSLSRWGCVGGSADGWFPVWFRAGGGAVLMEGVVEPTLRSFLWRSNWFCLIKFLGFDFGQSEIVALYRGGFI